MHSKKLKNLSVYIALFAAILPVLAFAQPTLNQTDAAGKKQGQWKKVDADGHVKYEGQFKDDKPTGKFIYYYPSGAVKTESYYSNNGTVCRTKTYHEETGKLMAEGKYVTEKKDSLWNYYSFDGFLISTENYIKGSKEGQWKSYIPDSNKTLVEIKNYKADAEDGAWEQYFPDGTLRTKAAYVKGKLEGVATYYRGEGKKLCEGKFAGGVRSGPWIYYTPEGKVEKVEKYVKGQLVGGPKLDKTDKSKGVKPPAVEQD